MIPDSWRYILHKSFRWDSAWTWIFLLTSISGASLTYLWIRTGMAASRNSGSGLALVVPFGFLVMAGVAVKTLRRWSGIRLDMLLQTGFEVEILNLPLFENRIGDNKTKRYRALWYYTDIPFRINLLTNNLLAGLLSLAILVTPGFLECGYFTAMLIIAAILEFMLSKNLAIREHQFEVSQSEKQRELSELRIACVNQGGSGDIACRIRSGQILINQGVIDFEKTRRRLIRIHRIPQTMALLALMLAYSGTKQNITQLPVLAIAGWKAWQALSSLIPVFSGWVRINRLVDECYKVITNQDYEYQNDNTIPGGVNGQAVTHRAAQVGAWSGLEVSR